MKDLSKYPPLFGDFVRVAQEVYPAFVKRLEQGISVGYIPDVVEGMISMKNNLGPERFKALDIAFKNADGENLEVLRQLTGITKEQWGRAFWGWGEK